jgi:hypothetical protein
MPKSIVTNLISTLKRGKTMTTALTIQDKQMGVVNDVLKQFKEMGGNIVGNETYLSVPPPVGFINSYEVVNICKDPRYKEVYPQNGGGLSLTAVGLKKLGKAMGIRFGPGEVVERLRDSEGNTLSIIFRSVACCRGLDGQFSWSRMDYEFDVTKRRQECENTQDKNMKYWNAKSQGSWDKAPPDFKICKTQEEQLQWRNDVVRIEMLQIEKNALTRAQTGSQTRCIRDLGAFPSTYLPEQLDTPFLVPKVVVYFDPVNPMDRAFALEQTKVPMMMFEQPRPQPTTSQVAAIEAQAPPLKLPPVTLPPPKEKPATNLPSETELVEIEEAMVETQFVESAVQDQEMQMSPMDNAEADFLSMAPEEQVTCIQQLIIKKKWSGNLNKTVAQFTAPEKKNFFLMLWKLETTKEEGAQAKLPWSN